MKAILEYNLPEDEEMFDLSYKGPELKWAIDEFDEFLRQKIKYTDQKTIDLEEVRAKLWEIVNGRME